MSRILNFQFRILGIRAQGIEDIFRCGQFRLRHMDKQALPVVVMAVGLVSVYGKQREQGDQLQALAQNVGDRDIVGVVVIGI